MKKALYCLKALLLLGFLLVLSNCQGQKPAGKAKTDQPSKSSPAPAPVAFTSVNKTLPDSNYGRIIKCARRDHAGNLWFATTWVGVLRYDGKKFTQFSVKDGLCSNEVNTILVDAAGKIWFGTQQGVCCYDGKTFINFPLPKPELSVNLLSKSVPSSPSNKMVESIFQDRAGNLWFGIWGGPGNAGAYRYDGKTFRHFFPETPIQGIVEDREGGIWLNRQRYNGKTFTDFSGRKDVLKEGVFCSLKDRDGNVWFGVRANGLHRYNGQDFTYFSAKDGLFDNRVSCIFQDKKGGLWLGSDMRFGSEKGGLCRYDGKTFTHFSAIYKLGMNSIWAATEDQQGNIWFGGRSGKLCRYNGKTFKDYSSAIAAFK